MFFPPVLKLLLHYPAGDNCQKLEMKESYISFFSLHNSYSVLPIQNITKGIVESVCVCVCVCVCHRLLYITEHRKVGIDADSREIKGQVSLNLSFSVSISSLLCIYDYIMYIYIYIEYNSNTFMFYPIWYNHCHTNERLLLSSPKRVNNISSVLKFVFIDSNSSCGWV